MRRLITRSLITALTGGAGLGLWGSGAAQAAPSLPFGHACTPQNGVLFCPSTDDASRVASFDGTPLDVDVTLPATGSGPFPTIVMLHGYGGSKTAFEATSPAGQGNTTYHYNNVFYAQRGYAVVTASARGFGNSCGTTASQASPGCSHGWLHFDDQRYELRDVQYLLGLLVDQGITQAGAIGATGISYGGGASMELAFLRNRVRLPDGTFAAWTSPHGTPLSLAAAFPRWGWSDFPYSLVPNGTFLDFRRPAPSAGLSPFGIPKASMIKILYLAARATGFVAPPGADPSADLQTWRDQTLAGEPFTGLGPVFSGLQTYHSSTLLGGTPAPLLIENGFTDDVFPPLEALRVYNQLGGAGSPRAPALMLGDLGHFRGGNKLDVERDFNDRAAAWLDQRLRRVPAAQTHAAPLPGQVLVHLQTCPRAAGAGAALIARSWRTLHPGAVELGARRAQVVTAGGGDPATARAIDPTTAKDECVTVPSRVARGTATASIRSRGFTLAGLPTVRASVSARGAYPQLAARLWDVSGSRQLLVSRGQLRLRANQHGTVTFQLQGNAYRFARGHVARLELLGNDPGYLLTNSSRYSVTVSRLAVELPTRERRSRRLQIVAPRLAR